MSKILIRDCMFKAVFQFLFNNKNKVENLFEEYKELSDEEKKYILESFSIFEKNFDEIKQKIQSNLAKNLKLSDLYMLDYAILVDAIFQIDYLNDTVALGINEAVELAKKYSTEKSPKFVNGVLSTIYNSK